LSASNGDTQTSLFDLAGSPTFMSRPDLVTLYLSSCDDIKTLHGELGFIDVACERLKSENVRLGRKSGFEFFAQEMSILYFLPLNQGHRTKERLPKRNGY